MIVGEDIFGKQQFLTKNIAALDKFHNINDTLTGIILNVVDYCNLRCSYCPAGNDYLSPFANKEISIDTVKRVANSLGKKFKGYVSLSGFGEPTLHPKINQIISIFANCCPETNILLLTNSILIRVIEKIDFFENLWIYCSEHRQFTKYTIEILNKIPNKVILRHAQFNKRYFNNRASNIKCKTNNLYTNCCNMPFYKMFIDISGDVLLCHSDWRRRNIMGNINNNQIYDIWKNSKYEKIRRNLIHNRRDNNLLCKKCDIDGRLEGNEFVNEWSKYYS